MTDYSDTFADPIFKLKDYWYFYNETWTQVYGPFETRERAETEFMRYGNSPLIEKSIDALRDAVITDVVEKRWGLLILQRVNVIILRRPARQISFGIRTRKGCTVMITMTRFI